MNRLVIEGALLLSVGILTLGMYSCDSPSSTNVTAHTITDISPNRNLLAEGGFEDDDVTSLWVVGLAADVEADVTRVDALTGNGALELVARDADVRESVYLDQVTSALPERQPGAGYELSFGVKTTALNRPLPVAIKFGHIDGSYRFTSGDPSDPARIAPGTTDDWRRVSVRARAAKPLAYVDAFVVNSGPGRLHGRVLIDDVSLRLVR